MQAAPFTPTAPARASADAAAAEVPAPQQEPLGQRIARWIARSISVGVGLSIIIHVVMLLFAAVMSVGIAGLGGSGSGGHRDYELTASEAALTGVTDAPLDSDLPAAADAELPDLPTSGVMEGAGGVDAPASGEGLGQIADGLGGAGGGDIGEGEGLGAGGAGGGGTSFFGVEAKGSRFAYIVDISGSMQGNKIAALKIELNESIGSMLEHMSYWVIPFSSTAQPLGEQRKWSAASEAGKRWAATQVNQLRAEGGTEPWPAFEMVLNMRPPPDAVYFMTDGQFDPQVADMVAVRNRGAKKIPIHCIGFGEGVSEELLRKIASQSGGTYAFVKGPR